MQSCNKDTVKAKAESPKRSDSSEAQAGGTPAVPKVCRKKGALARHLEAFLNEPELSDVLLRFAGKQYRAHGLLLAAWSPILERRLATGARTPLDGGDQGSPLVLDCDADWPEADVTPEGAPRVDTASRQEAFQQLLCFLYTGRAEVGGATVGPLLTLARAYSIGSLRALCERHLAREIDQHSVETAIRWLDTAERDELPLLRQDCLRVLRTYLQYLPEQLWLGLRLDQLVAIIEGSDIVVDDEYALFLKIEMWVKSKQEQGDVDGQSRVDKILPHLRFAHMTIRQLQQVSQSELGQLLAQRQPALLMEAIKNRALDAEMPDAGDAQRSEQPSVPPRLYLAFAPPGERPMLSSSSADGVRAMYTRVRCANSEHSQIEIKVFCKSKGGLYLRHEGHYLWRVHFVPREQAPGGPWCLQIQATPDPRFSGKAFQMVMAIKPRQDSTSKPIIVTHVGTVTEPTDDPRGRDEGKSNKIAKQTPYNFQKKPEYVYALVVVYVG